jgi:hypothetical protein
MGAGYFSDGTTHIALGAHVFALPAGRRRNVSLEPHSQPATVLDSGGGILELEVTAQCLRSSLGDAERFIYEMLRALALSGIGDMGVEDGRGYRHVYGDAVCLGGQGEVRAFTFADMRLDFTCPEKSAEPAWRGVPDLPGAYAGASTLQDYAAGGVQLGLAGSMRIEMSRAFPLVEIPRARGARSRGPVSGAVMRFVISVCRIANMENLATDIEDLTRSIGPRAVALQANGNVYTGCILESVRPVHTDAKHTMVDITFVQDLNTGGAGEATTTTTA